MEGLHGVVSFLVLIAVVLGFTSRLVGIRDDIAKVAKVAILLPREVASGLRVSGMTQQW